MPADITVRSAAPRPWRELLNPVRMAATLWSHRHVTWQMARREVLARYRGSVLGGVWAILNPLLLLAIYTFVFGYVFRPRWSEQDLRTGEFALTVFCGMLVFNIFSEVVQRAPQMVVHNPNYVTKVVFPLEIFVPAGLLSALFNFTVGAAVWVVAHVLLLGGPPPASIAWLPVALLPVVLLTLGVGWFLASLGVFIRDVGYAVTLIVQMLFFLTPVFYGIQAVPLPYRRLLEINPLSHAIEDARRAMLHGGAPEWAWWAGTTAAAALLLVAGYAFFTKSRRAFADVL